MFQPLPQTLGLVVPSLIVPRSPDHEAEDDKRDRNDGDKQSHLRSPLCAPPREG
jgi:hypothetical protein